MFPQLKNATPKLIQCMDDVPGRFETVNRLIINIISDIRGFPLIFFRNLYRKISNPSNNNCFK